MNLDELEKEFWGDQREQPTRVRLARVVRALRDEIFNRNSRCGWCVTDGALSHVADTINEILGDAAEEAAPETEREGSALRPADYRQAEPFDQGTVPPAQGKPTIHPDPASVCTWSHPKPGPEGQLIEYERSTCGKPKWRSFKFTDTKCQCGREVFVDYNDPANVMLLRPRS